MSGAPGASFERGVKTAGLVLGPALFLLLLSLPLPGLSTEAGRLAAVLALCVTFWVTEAIPLPATALLGAVLNVLSGVAPAKEVLAPFSDPIIFLFIGSFMLARALTAHGLDRRLALGLLAAPGVHARPAGALWACGLTAAFLSMGMSNTAATAIMLPIVLGVYEAVEHAHARRADPAGLFIMIAYAASAGGLATPIGTPPNLIGIGLIDSLAGVRITFLEWMALGLPVAAVSIAFLGFVLDRLLPFRPDRRSDLAPLLERERRALGPLNRGERNTLAAFAVAVALWLVPSVFALTAGKDSGMFRAAEARLNEGAVAMFAASLLFFLPVDWRERRFTLTWKQAAEIDWGTILLFGGGMSLGRLMFATGLAARVGDWAVQATGASGLWEITALSIALAIVLSEATSNTASANMTIPVVIAMAKDAGVSPVPPALGACLGSSFGFMLPVSTAPNALVFGTGLVPLRAMMRAGVIFDLAGGLIIFGLLRLLAPLFGWD